MGLEATLAKFAETPSVKELQTGVANIKQVVAGTQSIRDQILAKLPEVQAMGKKGLEVLDEVFGSKHTPASQANGSR